MPIEEEATREEVFSFFRTLLEQLHAEQGIAQFNLYENSA